MSRPKIAILASGQGTMAEAFIRAAAEGKIEPIAAVVICNNPDAEVFGRVSDLNKELGLSLKAELINSANSGGDKVPGGQTAAEQEAIIKAIDDAGCELVVLMGYMKKIGSRLVERYGWHAGYTSPYQAMMLNTHPGPLPDTKGLIGVHVQEYVLEKKLPYAAQTVHIVSEGYDEGPTIVEHRVEIQPGDMPDSLFERVRKVERDNLPGDIDGFIKKRRQYLASHIQSD